MAKAIYRDGRAFALGVVGAAALLATMGGEYLMHNPAFARTGTVALTLAVLQGQEHWSPSWCLPQP